MDYRKEIGNRIREARDAKGWTLEELSRRTGDALGVSRISHYETGLRMPGPREAVILAKALGRRAAWIMAVDDAQLPISPLEEALIKNWRTLSERERMDEFRRVETMSITSRDAAPDFKARPSGSIASSGITKRRKLRSEG